MVLNVKKMDVFKEGDRGDVYNHYRELFNRRAGLIQRWGAESRVKCAFNVAVGVGIGLGSLWLYSKLGDVPMGKMLFGVCAAAGFAKAAVDGVMPMVQRRQMRNVLKEMDMTQRIINNVYPDTQWVDALEGISTADQAPRTIISFHGKLPKAPK